MEAIIGQFGGAYPDNSFSHPHPQESPKTQAAELFHFQQMKTRYFIKLMALDCHSRPIHPQILCITSGIERYNIMPFLGIFMSLPGALKIAAMLRWQERPSGRSGWCPSPCYPESSDPVSRVSAITPVEVFWQKLGQLECEWMKTKAGLNDSIAVLLCWVKVCGMKGKEQ